MDAMHIKQLRKNSLFSGLDEDQLALVLKHVKIKSLHSGQQLFREGDSAEYFFWVHSGLLKLYRLSPSGEEKIIEVVPAGQTFAEAIMFSDKFSHYPVNAEMIENGEVWCFSSNDFKALLEDSVASCFRLLGSLSLRLHKHVNEIYRLTLQTATDRVINYLLQHKSENSNDVKLLISKQTLASQLSIKPETLSRTLKKLSQDGLIKAQGSVITLQDLEALRARVQV